jgi:glucokinase
MITSSSEYALALDIGGTKLEAALIDHSGTILTGSRVRVGTGGSTTREVLERSAREAAVAAYTHLPDGARIVGVGVGSAGPLDLKRRAVTPLNMPRASGATFDALEDIVQAPVTLALDGTCIALAEHRFGAARGARTALALVVSTGVGGGLVVDGRVLTGTSGNAGHIGQMRIERRHDGLPSEGTVEGIASGPSTVTWARERGWRGRTGEDLARDYAAGAPVARAAVARSAAAVGTAIASVSTLLDLNVAVIAGGFANVADDYVDQVAAAVREESPFAYAADVVIARTGLPGTGPLVGAAALAFDNHDKALWSLLRKNSKGQISDEDAPSPKNHSQG